MLSEDPCFSPRPQEESVVTPSERVHTKGVLGIAADVRASGRLPIVAMSEELVKTVRGRTQAFYQRHDDLSVGQIAPVGTCAQWRSATKVRSLPYKAYFDLTEELSHKGATGPWGTAEHFLKNAFWPAIALMGPIIRRVTNDDYFYTFLKDQPTSQGWSGAKQAYPPHGLQSRDCQKHNTVGSGRRSGESTPGGENVLADTAQSRSQFDIVEIAQGTGTVFEECH